VQYHIQNSWKYKNWLWPYLLIDEAVSRDGPFIVMMNAWYGSWYPWDSQSPSWGKQNILKIVFNSFIIQTMKRFLLNLLLVGLAFAGFFFYSSVQQNNVAVQTAGGEENYKLQQDFLKSEDYKIYQKAMIQIQAAQIHQALYGTGK